MLCDSPSHIILSNACTRSKNRVNPFHNNRSPMCNTIFVTVAHLHYCTYHTCNPPDRHKKYRDPFEVVNAQRSAHEWEV